MRNRMRNVMGGLAALLSLLLCSCELETSDNGYLDGFWHLESIEYVQTGETEDLSDRVMFWSFQMRLLDLNDKSGVRPECMLRFEHTGNTLRVYSPYKYNREEGDEPLDEPSLLQPFGIQAIDETFNVEKLGDGKMVLADDQVRLRLTKF